MERSRILSPNASNARQGIKTKAIVYIGHLLREFCPNASNARQGIKTSVHRKRYCISTSVRTPPMPDRALRLPAGPVAFSDLHDDRPNASNARQGIKTVYRIRISSSERSVRTPPMPDRALRLPGAQGVPQNVNLDVRTPPMPDRALRLICEWRGGEVRSDYVSERLQCPTGH